MLLVKAEARRSSVHGLGLFAVEPIKKGTPVARWTEGHDMRMTPVEWAALPHRVRDWLYIHWWTRDDGNWYGTCDDGRFTNHSTTPNMLWDDAEKTSFACRDIEAGEELTEDYGDFDASFAEYADEFAAPGKAMRYRVTVQCVRCGELGTTISFDTAASLAAAAVKLAENETSADPIRGVANARRVPLTAL